MPELLLPFEGEWMAYIRRNGGSVRLSALQQRYSLDAISIKQAIHDGVLTEQVSIRDRMAVRKVLTVFPPEDSAAAQDALVTFPARAAKQREVLRFMLERGEAVPMQSLSSKCQHHQRTVRALADKGYLTLRDMEHKRDPYAGREFKRTVALPLTEGQQDVYSEIVATWIRAIPRFSIAWRNGKWKNRSLFANH